MVHLLLPPHFATCIDQAMGNSNQGYWRLAPAHFCSHPALVECPTEPEASWWMHNRLKCLPVGKRLCWTALNNSLQCYQYVLHSSSPLVLPITQSQSWILNFKKICVSWKHFCQFPSLIGDLWTAESLLGVIHSQYQHFSGNFRLQGRGERESCTCRLKSFDLLKL